MGVVVGEPQLVPSRKTKKGKKPVFYITWTDSIEASKEKSTKTTNYAKALEVFNRWRLRNLGQPTPRTIDEVPTREVLEFYRANRVAAKKNVERADYAIRRLKPFWGDRPVSVVNQQTLRDYEEYRVELHEHLFPTREPISDNTIIRELVVLRAALKCAYRGKLINQEVFIDLPAEASCEITYFTCKEAIGLKYFAKRAVRAKDYLPIFLTIGFLTGRRKTSILELRWKDIDLKAGIIKWQRNGDIETNKRRPIGALPKRLKRILIEHRDKHPDDEYVVSYNGRQIKDIKKSFGDAVQLLRLHLSKTTNTEYTQVLEKAYPHMMRHSCATWLMQKGTDKREACQFLGMTEDTLDRRYWYHHPDFQEGPANAF